MHARQLDNISSSAVELALYNSYVQDSGWYNDTIAKFSYIMTGFSVSDPLGKVARSNNNNFALMLSDGFGYRLKFGEEQEWYIDPQLELGYFSQSDFKQTLKNISLQAYLNEATDAVFTLISRVGSSFGYNFKHFTQDKDIDTQVYLGLFYEFDYH